MPEGERLLGRDFDLFLGRGQNLGPEPAILIEPAGVVHGVGQAVGVADLPGQLAHLEVDLPGPIRKAQVPQGDGQVGTAGHAGVVARARRPKPGALPVIVFGDGRRKSIPGSLEIRPVEHASPPP